MCIALLSTAHPDYALILLSNRDEFLHRPTAPAAWWPTPNQHVLGGRDLLRPIQGTWLGITKRGLVAVLTNFREEGNPEPEARSRGSLVNAFLTQPHGQYNSTADFVKHLVEDGDGLEGVGGFSLVCGRVGEPLAVISNRTPSVEGTTWVLREGGETVGLSNAAFADSSWMKVTQGKKMLEAAIEKDVRESKEGERREGKEFVEELFDLLSTDTLPRCLAKGAGFESYMKEFRNSIFIPAVGREEMDGVSADDLATARTAQTIQAGEKGGDGLSGVYGTQKQSVVLINRQGHVIFVERTLYDGDARPIEGEAKDRRFDFDTEEW